MISCPRIVVRTAWRNPSTSNSPSARRNFIRLRLARLQAVSSRNMYSEHGFDALIRPETGQVCQVLIVVSNCIPGSPHCQAAWEMARIMSRARNVSIGRPSVTARVVHSRSSTTACMNSSVTRTEWLAFWKKTES